MRIFAHADTYKYGIIYQKLLVMENDMEDTTDTQAGSSNRMKFIIGGLLIVAAVVYLIYSSTAASAQYFLTVEEVAQQGDDVYSRDLRISGAVIGDTIEYDPVIVTVL